MIEHLATGAGLAFFLFGLFVFFSAVLGRCSGLTMCSTGCTRPQWGIPLGSSAC